MNDSTIEEALSFLSFTARLGYNVIINANKTYDNGEYSVRIEDQCGDVLLQKFAPLSNDLCSVIIQAVVEYTETPDGKEVYQIWTKN